MHLKIVFRCTTLSNVTQFAYIYSIDSINQSTSHPSSYLSFHLAIHPFNKKFILTSIQPAINNQTNQSTSLSLIKLSIHLTSHSIFKPSIYLAIIPFNQPSSLSLVNWSIHLMIYLSSQPSNLFLIHLFRLSTPASSQQSI